MGGGGGRGRQIAGHPDAGIVCGAKGKAAGSNVIILIGKFSVHPHPIPRKKRDNRVGA